MCLFTMKNLKMLYLSLYIYIYYSFARVYVYEIKISLTSHAYFSLEYAAPPTELYLCAHKCISSLSCRAIVYNNIV